MGVSDHLQEILAFWVTLKLGPTWGGSAMATRRIAVETFRHFRISIYRTENGHFRALISRVDGGQVQDMDGRRFNDLATIVCDTSEEVVLQARRMIDEGKVN